jgi:hypothetical protein
VKNFDGSDQPAQRLEVASYLYGTNAIIGIPTCGTGYGISNGPITARTLAVPAIRRYPSEIPYAFYPFIAAIHQGRIYAMNEQRQWHLVSTCQDFPPALPLQPQGSPTIPAIPIITTPTDLTALAETQLVTGTGLVTDPANQSVTAACQDMVTNARYIPIYTNR